MSISKKSFDVLKTVLLIIGMTIVIFVVKQGVNMLKNISQISVVENGSLKFEEKAEGYIIRDEVILQGENSQNGMIPIVSEGQRVSKNNSVFRYYSNGEEAILNQIDTLDNEINAELERSGLSIFSTDITNLEVQIEKIVNSMYKVNDLEDLQDKISEMDTYVSKKTKITGSLSPEDSYVKKLIEQRNELENNLKNNSEIMRAPISGVVSYRIDEFENILTTSDFSYLNSEFLEKLKTKSGAIIPTNLEKGKVVDNFKCYIACIIDTEKASVANLDDKVTLRLPTGNEVQAKIVKIIEENDEKRVIVFEIKDDIEELVQYRQVSVDIIWWSYKGLKISNSAILEENDLNYVERNKAGYTEKIYVKVLRQNDTYSIIRNYTNDELLEIGMDAESIKNRRELILYDEILLH